MRLDAALDSLQTLVRPPQDVRRLVAPGDWATSPEALTIFAPLFAETLETIPSDRHVAAICLVNEVALGLAQAVHNARREDRFAIVSFGSQDAATRAKLSEPGTCLVGTVDLHPERYGEKLLGVCLRILNGGAVPPAVFVEHSFVPSAGT